MNIKESVIGVIKSISEPETKGNFTKREFVLVVTDPSNDKFSDTFKCQVVKDNIAKLDGFQKGDTVRCHCNLQGREWVSPNTGGTMYFTTLNVYGIAKEDVVNPAESFNKPVENEVNNNASDDLPF